MKGAFTTIATLAIAAVASAQSVIESRPFYLVARSHEAKYTGLSFIACHEGAAFEGLCLGPMPGNASKAYSTFGHNTTVYQPNHVNESAPGLLTYELRGGNFNESQAMRLSYNPASNVAVPLFGPDGTATYVAFDSSNRMNIQTNLDDTRGTNQSVNPAEVLYRWYICDTFVGYNLTTLAWVQGKYPPQNPTCVKTQVVRVFV